MVCGNVHEGANGDFDLKCAWCRQVIGGSNVKDSHGMCEDCYRRELETQRALGGLLAVAPADRIGEPGER